VSGERPVVRVAVLGAAGRMGRAVIRLALADARFALVAAVDRPKSSSLGQDVGAWFGVEGAGVSLGTLNAPNPLAGAQVVVDFSSPGALGQLISLGGAVPIVSGTTGVPEALNARLRAEAGRRALVRAANFSTGVSLLCELVEVASRALPDADIEVVELHHRHKQDAPSGTAFVLGEAAARGRRWGLRSVAVHGREGAVGARPAEEIGFHAVRLGDVVGEHTVWIGQAGERISLGHVATSRDTFARGALRAALWIATRPPGWYTMRDVLGLSSARGDG